MVLQIRGTFKYKSLFRIFSFLLAFFFGYKVIKAATGSKNIITLPNVSWLNDNAALEPINPPISAKIIPKEAIWNATFFFLMKFITAMPVPLEETNLVVPRAN